MGVARYSNLLAIFSALALCAGCGIRSGLEIGDAGMDAAEESGGAGSGAGDAAAKPELLCGNGVIDAPKEQCDGDELGGATCLSLGEGEEGELGCGPACLFDVSMCAPSYPTPGGYGAGPTAPVSPNNGGNTNILFDGGVGDGGQAAGRGTFGGGTQDGGEQAAGGGTQDGGRGTGRGTGRGGGAQGG